MRFGVRSKAVENLEDVKTGLITTRRIVFTPSVEVKDELQNTSIQITCLDEDGTVLKRVTSGDSGSIEDPENQVATIRVRAVARPLVTRAATRVAVATIPRKTTRGRTEVIKHRDTETQSFFQSSIFNFQ